ncbi:uncharacterized protein BDW70DRAFT_164591 [Aspergillus foveolatus]|uniref:uncharacterized protein n=1 Tax=Aspergillus foveolatus TaxID=210207 RepID=UPI003CCE2C9F
MNTPDLSSCDFGLPQDPAENNCMSGNIYAQKLPEFNTGYDSMLAIQIPSPSLDTTVPIMVEDAFPDIYRDLQGYNVNSIRQSSPINDQKLRPYSRNDAIDGLFTFDNFSTTSSADDLSPPSLASTMDGAAMEKFISVVEKLSVSVDKVCTSVGHFSEKLDEAVTSVERIHLQAESSSENTTASIDGFNAKVDSLTSRIDGLADTVGEIVKRERIAMEKFGNFAGRIDQPTSSLESQSGIHLYRRSSG